MVAQLRLFEYTKIIELHTLREYILWYMNYIFIMLLLKKKKK